MMIAQPIRPTTGGMDVSTAHHVRHELVHSQVAPPPLHSGPPWAREMSPSTSATSSVTATVATP